MRERVMDFFNMVGGCRTRDDAVKVYVAALREFSPADAHLWPVLNRAIIDFWSESALRYIKARAWAAIRKGARNA